MLHYRVLGKGAPLVILHGLFGSSDNWQSQAKKLADFYTVYLVDLRNHGHSFWSPAHTYALMAEDVHRLFEELNLKKIILLGHSMGAKVAMTLAQQHPSLLDKLILVDMGIKVISHPGCLASKAFTLSKTESVAGLSSTMTHWILLIG